MLWLTTGGSKGKAPRKKYWIENLNYIMPTLSDTFIVMNAIEGNSETWSQLNSLFVSLSNGVSIELKSGHYAGGITTEKSWFILIFFRMGG